MPSSRSFPPCTVFQKPFTDATRSSDRTVTSFWFLPGPNKHTTPQEQVLKQVCLNGIIQVVLRSAMPRPHQKDLYCPPPCVRALCLPIFWLQHEHHLSTSLPICASVPSLFLGASETTLAFLHLSGGKEPPQCTQAALPSNRR